MELLNKILDYFNFFLFIEPFTDNKFNRVGLAQSVACPPLARWVVSSPPGRVIPKTIIKMVQTASLHRHACVRVEAQLQPNCLKGRVVCGTVDGGIHLKDLLGSFVRVGYRIPVPDFYLVLHGLRCRKSTIMD